MNYYNDVTNEYTHLLQYYSDAQLDNYALGDSTKIKQLYTRVQPKTVPIGSLLSEVDKKTYYVNSPDGFVPVTDCIQKIKNDMYTVTFASGTVIDSSHDHLFQKHDGVWIYSKYLQVGDIILSVDGVDEVTHITHYQKKTEVYDLSVNHPNHRYYTAGICSHNTGKSVIMQNLAVNMIQSGMHGAYITLELSEELCASRMDSMTTGIGVQDVMRNIDKVELKVRLMSKKAGKLQIKYMQAQSTTNQIRSYCRELEIKNGVKLDFICVDYLDLLMPSGAKVDLSNLFIKDKLVSEELRNIAKEFNLILITGSQFNRTAVDETEFNAGQIAGSSAKVSTCDNLIGIFTSRSMRERGQYQFQLMKTRSSGGVGQKFELSFNTDTLRITDDGSNKDYGDSDNRDMGTVFRPRINETVNHDGVIETMEPEQVSVIKKVSGVDVQSNRLKNLLTSLKKSQE